MQILAQNPVVTLQTVEDTCIISITITNEMINHLRCPYCNSSLIRFGYYHKHPRGSEFNLRALRLDYPKLKGSLNKIKIIVPRLCCTSKNCHVAERNKSRLTTFGIFNPKVFMPFRQYLPGLMDMVNRYLEAENVVNQEDACAQDKLDARKTISLLNKKLSPTGDETDNDFFRDFIIPCRKSRIKKVISALRLKANYFFDKLLLTNYLTPETSSAPLKNRNNPYLLPSESIITTLITLLSTYVPLLPTQIAISYARTYWKIHLRKTDSSEKGGEFNDSS